MAYYVFNIGKPATSAWWAQNIARGVITAGFDGSPGDKGELKLLQMDEGDWVLAFANGHGYVGSGLVRGAKTYRLHTAPPPKSLSDHRHERKVDWIYYVDKVELAVTVAEAGSRVPRNTKERMGNDEVAARIIHLLQERSGSPSDGPSAPPLTGEYCCELWGPRGWQTVSVTNALTRPERIVRCPECHGAVRLHMAGPNGVPRAHAEHRVGHPGCTLGHYFRGIRSPHPSPVVDPCDSGLDSASVVTIEDDESSFPEGKESFKLHRRLERDGRLPRRVKAARLRETGRLECEVCLFNFSAIYGPLGDGFIEAHHRRPVHTLNGKEKTKAVDLALVCSNCHRMLHRAVPQMSVEELQAKLTKNRFYFSGEG